MGPQEPWGAPRNKWVRCGGRAGSAGRTQGSRIPGSSVGVTPPSLSLVGGEFEKRNVHFPHTGSPFSFACSGGPPIPYSRAHPPPHPPPDPSTHWLLCLGPVGKVQKQTIWRHFPRPGRGTHISWLPGAPRVVYLTFLPGQGMALHRKLALLSDFSHLGVQPSSRPPSCSRAHPPP